MQAVVVGCAPKQEVLLPEGTIVFALRRAMRAGRNKGHGCRPGNGVSRQNAVNIRAQSWRRIAAVLVAIMFSMGFVLAPQSAFAAIGSAAKPSPAVVPRGDCPAVIFIGARGSGEKDLAAESGLGPELNDLYQQMAKDLSGKLKVSPHSVVYAAASVDVLTLSKNEQNVLAALLPFGGAGVTAFTVYYVKYHLDLYLASINEGLKVATADLSADAAVCPDARFVLGGYSQGALVMHELLLNLSDNANKGDAASQALLRRITATVLIADPAKKSNTAAMHFGTAPLSAQGIKSFLTAGDRDVPTPSSTYDLCNLGDFVCDFSLATLVDKASFKAGINVHINSYEGKNKNTANALVTNTGSKIAGTLLSQLPGVVDHLSIAPATATVTVGTSQAYTATAVDPFNKPLGDVTAETTFGISPDGSCQGPCAHRPFLGLTPSKE
ncbi:hypothetical protein AHiyo8_00690 [Arthrobacter sp. Hiyo8]|nr:hypothetical protein AHiyo8_00690 [Arthrobacter sp. Hiyo8]